MSKTSLVVVALGPSVGPTVMILFGLQIPIAAFALAVGGLLLARSIAPKSPRKLSRWQERSLTALLVLILLVITAGEMPIISPTPPVPLGVGMAVVWGVGLGITGMLTIEFFGRRVVAILRAGWFGEIKSDDNNTPLL